MNDGMKDMKKEMSHPNCSIHVAMPAIAIMVISVVLTVMHLLIFQGVAGALEINDSLGHSLALDGPPKRIVSLVPTATEVLFELGAQDRVVGITYHDATLKGATASKVTSGKTVVGGFFRPSIEKVKALDPDLIIVSSLHNELIEALDCTKCQIFYYGTESINQGFDNIRILGKLVENESEAEAIIQKNQREIAHIKSKLEQIFSKKVHDEREQVASNVHASHQQREGDEGDGKKPDGEKRRKRVIRLMGRDTIMTPGNDSFQNDLIRMAGGIPPDFGKKGSVIPVIKEAWMAFNPEVIYGCGEDREAADRFFSQDGWKDVDAVKNHQIFYFPCELTCRAATHTGYFVSWLSSMIYTKEFGNPVNFILPTPLDSASSSAGVLTASSVTNESGSGSSTMSSTSSDSVSNGVSLKDSRPVQIDLPYIEAAKVNTVSILDFDNKTLMIDFKTPQTIVSTLEGERDGILSVGNHYSPPPTWGPGHYLGIETLRANILAANGKTEESTSFLITGANMDNLSVKEKRFKKMKVVAVATAGVMSNAVRMSKDIGMHYEPGTINIIIMSNMTLSRRAMTRAIISATEAKSAALDDMDIRSTYSPLKNPATGTGTDNILVVQGAGSFIDGKEISIENTGGHSKMGELVARAVYDAVEEAILKQNRVTASRHVFQRLKERKLSIYSLASEVVCDCMKTYDIENGLLAESVEHLFLEPRYSAFIASAFALSDDYERGLVKDLGLFDVWCQVTASEIAGKPVLEIENLVVGEKIPTVLKRALNAVFTGALEKLRDE